MKKFLISLLLFLLVNSATYANFLENNKNYLILNWHDHFCSYLNLESLHIIFSNPNKTELQAETIMHDFDYGYTVGFTKRYIFDHKSYKVFTRLITHKKYSDDGKILSEVSGIKSLYSLDTSKDADVIYYKQFHKFFYPSFVQNYSQDEFMFKYESLPMESKLIVSKVLDAELKNNPPIVLKPKNKSAHHTTHNK